MKTSPTAEKAESRIMKLETRSVKHPAKTSTLRIAQGKWTLARTKGDNREPGGHNCLSVLSYAIGTEL
jgi:hypothetical protein